MANSSCSWYGSWGSEKAPEFQRAMIVPLEWVTDIEPEKSGGVVSIKQGPIDWGIKSKIKSTVNGLIGLICLIWLQFVCVICHQDK